MIKNQLGPEGEGLTHEQLRQLADSYYGELEDDDIEDDQDLNVNIHDQIANNQERFNRVLNLSGLRADEEDDDTDDIQVEDQDPNSSSQLGRR